VGRIYGRLSPGFVACRLGLVVFALSFATLSAQQNLQLAAEVLKAYELIDSATADLLDAEKVVADVASGKKPAVPLNHRDTMEERFQTGARMLKAALPALLNDQHVLYVFASYGDVGTVQDGNPNSSVISPIGAVVFTVEK
jgi:hypothetical protein